MRTFTSARSDSAPSRRDGPIVGLDIGATSVRAALLTVRERDGRTVVEVGTIAGAALPPGTVSGGVVVDPGTLSDTLRGLWKSAGLKCRNVVLGVASPQVLVRELEMPDLAPAQRAKALPFQARDLIAMPLEEMVLDFVTLGQPLESTGMQPGLLVACPREPVLAAVAAVEAAGLRVSRVDLASLALLRSVTDGGYDNEVVIDIGADLTTIVVQQLGVPRLVRTVSRGADELTRRLASNLGVDPAEAEEIKRRNGLTGADPASAALRDLLAPLLAEIRSSLNYFRTTHPGAQIQRMLLTGGGSALSGLPDLLGEQMGIPCAVVDPAWQLQQPPRAKRPVDPGPWTSALSVGLAIGAAA